VDGQVQWLRWELYPWRQADGSIGGLLLAEDITRQKQALEDLREGERFRLAGGDRTVSGIGMFRRGNATTVSYFEMLGYTPGAFPNRVDTWIGLLHPTNATPSLRAQQRA
jgi:hypothetical protein